MLKKLLNIVFLITIVFRTNCMEEDLDFKQIFNNKIANEIDQIEINEFLELNFIYVAENLEFLYKVAFEKGLEKVIEYLMDGWKYKIADLINWAFETGNIEWVKKLTNFDDYLKSKDTVNCAGLYLKLDNLGLDIKIFDEICIHDKINYDLGHGYRYLQTLIRANKIKDKSSTILRFIKNASDEALNAKELDGSTPLDVAVLTWKSQDKIRDFRQKSLSKIIKALLSHGANPPTSQNDNLKPINSELFKQLSEKDHQIRKKNTKTSKSIDVEDSRNNVPLDKEKKVKKKSRNFHAKILTAVGISVIGAAVFYFGSKLLKKNNSNTTLRLK